MADAEHSFLAFNRGLVSRHALGRMDLKRLALSADTSTNWLPRALGSMSLRPGTKFLQYTRNSLRSVSIPAVYAADDVAIYEITDDGMRVLVDDVPVERTSVSATFHLGGGFGPYSVPCTFQNAGDTVTYTGGDYFANGDAVYFIGAGIASPLVAYTTYYVRDLVAGSNTFKVAATVGGAAIPLTSDGTGTVVHTTHLYQWTDSDEAGAVSTLVVTDRVTGEGYLSLTGTGTNRAMRDYAVTLTPGDVGVEHALRIRVLRGNATLSIGSTLGGEEYLRDTTLRPGWHSIAFTPDANFYIRLASSAKAPTLVESIAFEGETLFLTGNVVPTPWAEEDLDSLRWEQSVDVTFVACEGVRHHRIERRAARSWSVVEEPMTDGPFQDLNGGPITITPAALSGSTTLTASANLFSEGHVGGLVRISSNGQRVEAAISSADVFTDPIRVTGVDTGRSFVIERTGTWVGTVTLQMSVGAPGDWTDSGNYTTNGSTTGNDGLDNQIIYYRIGIKVGNYTSGTANVALRYSAGSIEGVALITEYSSPTVVSCDVITAFGQTTASDAWWLGLWSDDAGWPTDVCLFEGRLWWAGRGTLTGSASDAYSTFDDNMEGDGAPIKRGLGSGPNDTINWLLELDNLVLSTASEERVVRASSLDEPLTNAACALKRVGSQGSAGVAAVAIDTSGVFVQRGGARVYELSKDNGINYALNDLTAIVPEIGASPFVRLAVQRQPDTRVHAVREDGAVAILVYDKVEQVTCWALWSTDGVVEDVCVLPGAPEDAVYYTVRRTVNGATVRCRERWAPWSETSGGETTVLADSCTVYSGTATTTITGLSHLRGMDVVVWGNGKDLGTYTVATGGPGVDTITLSEACTLAVVGLPYPSARWRSAKLALANAAGAIGLNDRLRVTGAKLLLLDTHAQGLKVGQDFDHMDDLPAIERGVEVDPDSIWEEYHEDSVTVNGTWDTDARLCLEGQSPRPCTVLAVQAVVSR